MQKSFYEKFSELALENGYSSPSAAANALGISNSVVSSWKRRNSVPRYNLLNSIATAFNVSPKWLTGASEDREGLVPTEQQTLHIDEPEETRTVVDVEERVPDKFTASEYADAVLKFALFGDADNITQDDLDDVRDYAQVILMRKNRRKG